jgi:organic radical activating enzyme
VTGTLVVNEIYLSLQGESTFAGLPCVFIRLTACDLRCSYCDTAYAFTEGKKKTLARNSGARPRIRRPVFQLKTQNSKLKTSARRADRRRAVAPEKFFAADASSFATTASLF